jgi:hypothetical protein
VNNIEQSLKTVLRKCYILTECTELNALTEERHLNLSYLMQAYHTFSRKSVKSFIVLNEVKFAGKSNAVSNRMFPPIRICLSL